jgi:hypothetical protein
LIRRVFIQPTSASKTVTTINSGISFSSMTSPPGASA